MSIARAIPPMPSVYLNKHEYANFLRLKNGMLPGARIEPTQAMREVAKKLENVDERLIWTDTDGMLKNEQTWRASAIRRLPTHAPGLAVAEGQQNDVLIRTHVRTRLGDVLAAERPVGHVIELPYGSRGDAPPLAAISIHAGASEIFKPDNSTYTTSSAKKVQPQPPPHDYYVPVFSRPT